MDLWTRHHLADFKWLPARAALPTTPQAQHETKWPDSNRNRWPDQSEFSPIGSFKKSFAALLKGAGVETDSHGQKRTIYSLRHTYATFRLQEGVHQFILARNMGTSTAMLEKHYGHTSNVASAAELTKGGRFKGGKKAGAVDWLVG